MEETGMTSKDGKRTLLLATTALGAIAFASAAFAQTETSNPKAVEEVVVTATRQTSTVNKVALSVSAVTQKNLDQQGIRSVADLSTQVPGFTYRVTGGDSIPQLSLRGIGGNAIASTSGGAPTTGVYIDDIAMQKRNLNGATSGSGTPVPLLYDLDRIEVLRGPQGTLYGGSSEGGTIRFITPTPSLTTFSGSARLGVSTMSGGGMGNEQGLALGGPIVQDKLGFRVAGFHQARPGWINSYSQFDGHQFGSQINRGEDYSLRGSLLWQVTPDFRVQLSVHNQTNYDQDTSTVRTSSPSINIPVRTLANCNFAGATATSNAAAGHAGCGTTGINGVSFSFPASVFGGYTVPAAAFLSNNARNGVVNGLYLTPTNVIYQPSPHRVMFTIPSLTMDYIWNDKIDFKSITADTMDRTSGYSFTGGNGERSSVLPFITNQPCPSGPGLVTPILNAPGTCTINTPFLQFASTPAAPGQPSPNPTGAPGPANIASNYWYNNGRNQVTQEFRVSTVDPSWKLQFVFGGFIEHELDTMTLCAPFGEAPFATLIRGANGEAYYNGTLTTALCQTPGAPMTDIASRTEEVTENEQSIFGEASYQLTRQFKITAGFRATNYTQDFWTRYGGPVGSAPAGWVGSASTGLTTTNNGVTSPLETNPNSIAPFPNNYAACPLKPESVKTQTQAIGYASAGCPYTYTVGTLKENPVVPKFGLTYQITDSDMLYATYSEGQRPGGINPPASPILCAPSFALLGITGSPPTYQHDTVKSTEVGGKFRLFNGQAQVNVAAFHIDWENVQFVVQLPSCTGYSFVANSGKAASDGGELQFTGRAWGFTVNANIAYDNARFTETVYGPHAPGQVPPASALVANKGDNLGIPDWTANLGIQYDTRIMDYPVYARADYAYQGKYMRATSPGTASFTAAPFVTPNYINGNETHIMNARVGVYYKNLEISGYVKNLFDSREWINLNQANGNYFFTGNTVQPRLIGMQLNYRF
jgi:outer membrane receptor protein involved in Fe transport